MSILYFMAVRDTGGYGDKIVGLMTALTLTRIYGFKLVVVWSEEYMKRIFKDACQITDIDKETPTSVFNWIDHQSKAEARRQILQLRPDTFYNRNATLYCNQAYDIFCWGVGWILDILQHKTYEEICSENYRTLYKAVCIPTKPISEFPVYDLGIQIRTGDVQFGRPQDAYIKYMDYTHIFDLYVKLSRIIEKTRDAIKTVYITGDQYDIVIMLLGKLTEEFEDDIVFTTTNMKKNYHSDKLVDEFGMQNCVESHIILSRCRSHIISRSNFGITAANYACSSNRSACMYLEAGAHSTIKITYADQGILIK